jgi:hypothetical protein
MSFNGRLLERGFWLYVWRVSTAGRTVLYVGRTGDSSSRYASSPFRRIGQHLDLGTNAKANAMARQLRRAMLDPAECEFSMSAIGPLFPEQPDFERHRHCRDATAGLERALAAWLRDRGYDVLGTHSSRHPADPQQLASIAQALAEDFPAL